MRACSESVRKKAVLRASDPVEITIRLATIFALRSAGERTWTHVTILINYGQSYIHEHLKLKVNKQMSKLVHG